MDSVQEKLLRSGYEDVKLLTDVSYDVMTLWSQSQQITELCTITT